MKRAGRAGWARGLLLHFGPEEGKRGENDLGCFWNFDLFMILKTHINQKP
jgi:hypothetical protein